MWQNKAVNRHGQFRVVENGLGQQQQEKIPIAGHLGMTKHQLRAEFAPEVGYMLSFPGDM